MPQWSCRLITQDVPAISTLRQGGLNSLRRITRWQVPLIPWNKTLQTPVQIPCEFSGREISPKAIYSKYSSAQGRHELAWHNQGAYGAKGGLQTEGFRMCNAARSKSHRDRVLPTQLARPLLKLIFLRVKFTMNTRSKSTLGITECCSLSTIRLLFTVTQEEGTVITSDPGILLDILLQLMPCRGEVPVTALRPTKLLPSPQKASCNA